mmetsp:Transcript_4961/g.12797  ORF Transcript_4961/g.12797 Transcript_4961/m.12797 type:complete len:257 (-) Transcript_4961:176-946(-)|eukprot:CAMPEP_0179858362 /NCGR_PEP_ID=MMETSP0982-20121206/12345_1 /TAXON_ID=483367 /ORGANISM="non described non described, Strain CCMP 2436" /LENGTH=256 /DNA_ID=CAMNT_0021745147 /DNA_START=298 /DNA_END=1068 /DNA_ORIENTATION=+
MQHFIPLALATLALALATAEDALADTPVGWWCADAVHIDSLVCRKMRFKAELRRIEDPAERARQIEARREEAMVRPSAEQLRQMRTEESDMLEGFCALPDKAEHPFCVKDSLSAVRRARHDEDKQARRDEKRAHRERLEPTDRPVADYDLAVAWYCTAGGHPDGASHAAESMVCAAWRYRQAMHGAGSHGESAEAKTAIVDEYRKTKERHKEANNPKAHMLEQQQMLASYCALEAHEQTRLCMKYLARVRKTELRG